jgi:membrane-associated phospholipid phosphatase
MPRQPNSIVADNRWFLIPCLLWFIAGGIFLLRYNSKELFFAINQVHSPFWDKAMGGFSAYGRGDIIPFILVGVLLIPAMRNKQYILSGLGFGIIIPVFVYCTKLFFHEPRPILLYGNELVHSVPWLKDLTNNSFPSGHTFGAFGFFMLLSIILPSKQKIWSLLFFLLAFLCGYSRMYLGQHFFLDVWVGSIFGTVFTILIYKVVQYFLSKSVHK